MGNHTTQSPDKTHRKSSSTRSVRPESVRAEPDRDEESVHAAPSLQKKGIPANPPPSGWDGTRPARQPGVAQWWTPPHSGSAAHTRGCLLHTVVPTSCS